MKTIAKKEKERIKKKFGPDIVNDFEKLSDKHFWNLADIGRKYGFTRETARLIYKKLYGTGYIITKNKKDNYLHEEISSLICSNNPLRKVADFKKGNNNTWKGALVEKLFYRECEDRNFKIDIFHNRKIDMMVNEYLVDIKSCFKPYFPSKDLITPYYKYVVSKYQSINCDFIACFYPTNKSFFIIPKKDLPQGRNIYILSDKSKSQKERYFKYENSWDLLSSTKNYFYRFSGIGF